jgi:N-acetylmuramoyl-L-alanine amidase
MQVGKYLILFLVICGVVALTVLSSKAVKNKSEIINTATVPKDQPFTILVVPGHETNNGGARFLNIYERDLVVDVADNISALLNQNPKYKIIIARDKQIWNPIFSDYFSDNQQAIIDFKNEHQAAYKLLVSSGEEKVVPDMGEHTLATPRTAVELYGINKWADENNVDLVIHLHFNNSNRRNIKLPGPHKGFDMFIPEKQSVNAPTSRIIAEDIYNELKKKFSPEAPGYYNSLFEDQSLIALGASNTLSKPSVLIEYGYIYEKMLQTEAGRKQALGQMAEQTVAGIQDYIDSINPNLTKSPQ